MKRLFSDLVPIVVAVVAALLFAAGILIAMRKAGLL